jgi:hypothetical protein
MSPSLQQALDEHSELVEKWALTMIKKYDLPSTATDTLWVFNRESFCYMVGEKSTHSESCTCDDDYDGVAQDV